MALSSTLIPGGIMARPMEGPSSPSDSDTSASDDEWPKQEPGPVVNHVVLDVHGDPIGRAPTAKESARLRRVPSKLQWQVFSIAFIEFCERFSYYGTVTILTNFVQWPRPAGSTTGASPNGQAGALGLGQKAAVAVATSNTFWQYTMPYLGAYVAENRLGRFQTIAGGLVLSLVGHGILVASAVPPVLQLDSKAWSMLLLVGGLVVLGFGTGAFKPNINTLIAEQVEVEHMYVARVPRTHIVLGGDWWRAKMARDDDEPQSDRLGCVFRSLLRRLGRAPADQLIQVPIDAPTRDELEHELERIPEVVANDDARFEWVIVDPAVTTSNIFHNLYTFIQLGAIGGQAGMALVEKYVGFWLAFVLPTVLLSLCPIVLLWGRQRYRRTPPEGSVLRKAWRLFALANAGRWSWSPVQTHRQLHDGTFWESVKPSRLGDAVPAWMDFDDAWVDEVARGLRACKVFLFMPVFWLCYAQVTTTLVGMSATMKLYNLPNDLMLNLEPTSLIVVNALLTQAVLPLGRRLGVRVTPIRKIAVGFVVASLAMAWAAGLQSQIYAHSVCGHHASGTLSGTLPDANERCPPTDVSVWWSMPIYILISTAEVLIAVTCMEYAQTKAPRNMRSMVQALQMSTNAVSTALGFALIRLTEDPLLTWNFVVCTILSGLAGITFFLFFRGLDAAEDAMNELDASGASPPSGQSDLEKTARPLHAVKLTPVTSSFSDANGQSPTYVQEPTKQAVQDSDSIDTCKVPRVVPATRRFAME